LSEYTSYGGKGEFPLLKPQGAVAWRVQPFVTVRQYSRRENHNYGKKVYFFAIPLVL